MVWEEYPHIEASEQVKMVVAPSMSGLDHRNVVGLRQVGELNAGR